MQSVAHLWVDLVDDGFARDNVIWYYKLDTDGAVEAQSPNGWKDSDYVVATDSMRTGGNSSPDVRRAITNSTSVAVFGTGDQQVDVRRIDPDGKAAADQAITKATDDRKALGTQLAENPGIDANEGTLSQFRAGQVDSRSMILLGQLLADHTVQVDRFRPLTGEEGQTFRRLTIEGGSTAAARQMERTIEAVRGDLRPAVVQRDGDRIVVTFAPSDPTTNPTAAR